MEEDLNQEELEEQFYSMLHHVDDTKTDVTPSENALNAIKNAPQSTVRRYWRTSEPRPASAATNTAYQKVNIPKQPPRQVKDDTKPKAEKCPAPVDALPLHLSIFQTTSPQNVKKTIEIIEHEDDKAIEIMTSDDDEVVEVALPPKPTITIDSSDDETEAYDTPAKTKTVLEKETQSREVSASPVPSIVSSVSDDFIRGDCVAFNISRRPEKNSFDFSLHEADLEVGAPPKKKKKKKNKENANTATSTPILADITPSKPIGPEECFATPKSKAKNKKSKTKLYTVTETSIPNADVYDSDSNQSAIDVHTKNNNSNVVTEPTILSTGIFESDVLGDITSINKSKSSNNVDSSDSSSSLPKKNVNLNNIQQELSQRDTSVIDLTENAGSEGSIEENIVMANVTGFTESDDYHDQSVNSFSISDSRLGSTKVPDILLQNTDFDNMKGTDRPSRKRRYSMATLRDDMQKFYNDSWGGEDFNHREIQKTMSRDKSLWVIDMKDKVPMYRKKNTVTCNYCNRAGHRDDACWQKPPVCHMCGLNGHREPKCPYKVCFNCGSPGAASAGACGACAGWARCVCAHCRQRGHPASHCAVLWRRFHHTIYNPYAPRPPIQNMSHVVSAQNFAGGNKRLSYPQTYETQANKRRNLSLYNTQNYSTRQDQSIPPQSESFNDRNRQYNDNRDGSASTQKSEPNLHKNRNIPLVDNTQTSRVAIRQEKTQPANEGPVDRNVDKRVEGDNAATIEKPYKILLCKKKIISNAYTHPIPPNNSKTRQERRKSTNDGQLDRNVEPNERQVVVGSIENVEKSVEVSLSKKRNISATDYTQHTTQINSKAPARQDQKKRARSEDPSEDKNAKRAEPETKSVSPDSVISKEKAVDFIPISSNHDAQGHVIQDNNVTASNSADDCDTTTDNCSQEIPASHDIPYNKYKALRKLNKALLSLHGDLGEPNALHKELNYLQNKHKQLLNQKQISPKKLKNNRGNIKDIAQKLNLVLLGQAGLGGGSTHVQELHLLKDKLVHIRQKTVPNEMRTAIGEHFHSIFSNMPRDDYWELLNTYNNKQTKSHKNAKSPGLKKKVKKKKKEQNQQQNKSFSKEVKSGEKMLSGTITPQGGGKAGKALGKEDLRKLVSCWRKLVQVGAGSSGRKGPDHAKSARLARQLHAHIVSISKNANTSAKNLKKIRKIEAQAKLLLSNA